MRFNSPSRFAVTSMVAPDGEVSEDPPVITSDPNPAPVVSVVSPLQGSISAATSLTINGTGFLANPTVTVGGNPCAGATRVSATQITCDAPPHNGTGSTSVVVTNSDAQSATGSFEYIFSPTRMDLLAGVLDPGGVLDGIGRSARLYQPYGLVEMMYGGAHLLFVSDYLGHTIRKVDITDISNPAVTVFAGTPGTSGYVDGIGVAARFNGPMAITTDGSDLYVSDLSNLRIRRIVIATGAVTTLAGSGALPAGDVTDDNAIGTSAKVASGYGIAVSSDLNTLYFGDLQSNSIRSVSLLAGSHPVAHLAGSYSAGYSEGTGTGASFNSFAGFSLYNDGLDGDVLFVADRGNSLIRRVVTATGVVTTIAGDTIARNCASGVCFPSQITNDGTSVFFTSTDIVKKALISNGTVSVVAGTGANGNRDQDGTEGVPVATFSGASQIVIDSGDSTVFYVTDQRSSTLRMIHVGVSTTVTTLVGTPYPAGGAEGTAVDADGLDLSGLSETEYKPLYDPAL